MTTASEVLRCTADRIERGWHREFYRGEFNDRLYYLVSSLIIKTSEEKGLRWRETSGVLDGIMIRLLDIAGDVRVSVPIREWRGDSRIARSRIAALLRSVAAEC